MRPLFSAVLKKTDHPGFGAVSVPFPIPEDEYDHILSKLRQIDIGDAVQRDCLIGEIRNGCPVLANLEGGRVTVDQLDYLAKRLDSFTEYEVAQFQAAAFCGGYRDIAELINLTFCCQQVTVISDVSKLETVGRNFYLNSCGGSASFSDLQRTDFLQVALDLIRTGDGKITPYGMLYDNGMEMTDRYNGRSFPPYFYEVCEAAVTISSTDRPDENELLCFPCADSKIARAKERLCVKNPEEFSVPLEMTGEMSQPVIDVFDRGHDLREHLEELNHVARCYKGFNVATADSFHAIVEYACPQTPEDILRLAENIYDFIVAQGVHNPEEYGRYIIDESGRYELDADLDSYMDYRSFGEDLIDAEGGVFANENYIAYQGNDPRLEELFARREQEREMAMGGM